jgi:membrane protein DedA with SNARE-associated domain
MLTGFCVPISEDIMLLIGGATAARCIPEQTFSLYITIYFACWFSAWEAYWLGRILGPRLFNLRWFNRFVTPELLERIRGYYQRFGIFTFIAGRFIPGGVRNAIFLTSGVTEIPFLTFILRDGVACFIATATIFTIGYKSGQHLEVILETFKTYERVVVAVVFLAVLTGIFLLYRHYKKSVG